MSPEVLIYLQTVKNWFNINEETRKYFLTGVDEDLFFHHLSEISQKNFESNGDAMLDINQFELLRKTMLALSVINQEEPIQEEPNPKGPFFDYPGFGTICLN